MDDEKLDDKPLESKEENKEPKIPERKHKVKDNDAIKNAKRKVRGPNHKKLIPARKMLVGQKKISEWADGKEPDKTIKDAIKKVDSLERTRVRQQRRLANELGFDYSSLQHLKCIKDVDALIDRGYSIPKIAKFIQEEKKEATGYARGTLIGFLYRYIQNLPLRDILQKRVPEGYFAMKNNIGEHIDGIEAVETLFLVQYDRCMQDYGQEKMSNRSLEITTKNIALCADLAVKIEEMKHKAYAVSHKSSLQAAMLVEREKEKDEDIDKKVDEMKEKIAEKYGKRMSEIAADPIRRRKLLTLFERMTKAGERSFKEILKRHEDRLAQDADDELSQGEIIDVGAQKISYDEASDKQVAENQEMISVNPSSSLDKPLPLIEG